MATRVTKTQKRTKRVGVAQKESGSPEPTARLLTVPEAGRRYFKLSRNFAEKMADVLSVYREVKVLKKAAAAAKKANDAVAIICYDEKPGIQATATPAPDLPPMPGVQCDFRA
jgi:hypothetical protein